MKSFLSRVNCKMTTAKLQDYFNEVDTRRRSELNFDDFSRLYQKILVNPTVCQFLFNFLMFVLIFTIFFRLFKTVIIVQMVNFPIQKIRKLFDCKNFRHSY